MCKLPNSFSFLVVSYNHENYIIEHLESIKYQVETHGKNIHVDIIINDDNSKDRTVSLVDSWLKLNDRLFRNVVFLKNQSNIGTCASVINMLAYISTDASKLTAGDDVYSYENIFEYALLPNGFAIQSGIALDLTDGVISEKKMDTINAVATDVVYREKPLSLRFKHLSFNNAPNIIYSVECLKNDGVKSIVSKYDVVEDWPLQIAISSLFPHHRFKLIYKTLVYYRRTTGSTYIVANKRFTEDKKKIYDFLIEHENNYFHAIRLKVRKWCFCKSNKFLNKFANIDFYIYIASVFVRAPNVIRELRKININVMEHSNHYKMINEKTKQFMNNL